MTEGQGGTPAGWYPDPEGNGERWWNGMSWGELRQAPPATPRQPYPPQPYGQQQPEQPTQQAQRQQATPWGQQAQQQPQSGQPQPQPGQAPAGQGLRCVNCQFTDFSQAEFLLNTRNMTMFDLDAFNAAANCLICRRCGFIHWFAQR